MAAEPSANPTSSRIRHRIRRAKAEDAAVIASLVASPEDLRQASPLENFPLERSTVLHWLLQRDAGYVLEERGEIVAYGELVPDEGRRDRFWIGHMIVHPRRRGLGLGQRLVHELIRIAETVHDAREVAISAFADNLRALRCYEACGFARVDVERVEGRPLVSMRLRFESRKRSPGVVKFLTTGAVAAGLVWALHARSPHLIAPLAALWLGAGASHGLARERRDRWLLRMRASVWMVSIGLGAAILTGLVLLPTTGNAQLIATMLLTCGSAALGWVALLAVLSWRRV